MVLFSVVNTMFMPEWGLNCCGSTQSIIAPIYFFVNLTQIFDLYLHLSTTDVIFIMIWLEKKKERKKKKMGCVFSRQDINDVHSDTFSVINVDDQVMCEIF